MYTPMEDTAICVGCGIAHEVGQLDTATRCEDCAKHTHSKLIDHTPEDIWAVERWLEDKHFGIDTPSPYGHMRPRTHEQLANEITQFGGERKDKQWM